MNKMLLRRLFAYDLWANNCVLGALDVLAPLNTSDPLAQYVGAIEDGFAEGLVAW